MAGPTSVWALDIGQVALKGLKVQSIAGKLQVDAFEVIEHAKILSQPDADRQQLIRTSLERFLATHDVSGSLVAVSVPGQSGFTRFVKLPPVDTKKIPDIVRYEAEQQIPFAIAEVNWRWQTFFDPDSPDVEVGIFAMKRTDVSEVLEQLSQVGLNVDLVQMTPLALCNYMTYDGQLAEDGATLLVDVGADKTDLVVSDGPRIWTRTIQIGGNNFTEALVRAFKLSFSKAEKLKRTAATSKYARQIFQAMRPVFADLVQEIQRSVGYYSSLHREARFRRLIGLGNGFRLPGLQKFLEQNLNVPVVRIDTYKRLSTAAAVNAPTFHENVLSFAVGYGLAIQALNEPRVQTNLLPEEIVRRRMWNKKRPWFAAAAGLLVIVFALPMFRAFADRGVLRGSEDKYAKAAATTDELRRLQEDYERWEKQGGDKKDEIAESVRLLGHRDYWPSVLAMVSQSIKEVAGEDQRLLTEYSQAGDEATRKNAWEALKNKPRRTRKLITIMNLEGTYLSGERFEKARLPETTTEEKRGFDEREYDDFEARIEARARGEKYAAQPDAQPTKGRRGFMVVLKARTPYIRKDVSGEIIARLRRQSVEFLKRLPSVGFAAFRVLDEPSSYREHIGSSGGPDRGGRYEPSDFPFSLRSELRGSSDRGWREEVTPQQPGAEIPDPLFPDDPTEDMSEDTVFKICWILSIEGDGLPPTGEKSSRQR